MENYKDDCQDYQEDDYEHDSDLEAQLYAEIYYKTEPGDVVDNENKLPEAPDPPAAETVDSSPQEPAINSEINNASQLTDDVAGGQEKPIGETNNDSPTKKQKAKKDKPKLGSSLVLNLAQLLKNKKRNNKPSKSVEVIVLSDESDTEKSKYFVAPKSTKVLKRRKMEKRATGQMSDSDESIFEVPVPPKPMPIVVEVNDSEDEGGGPSTSGLQKQLAQTTYDSDTKEPSSSDSEDPDTSDLIINCTEVQKGASSLSEIRDMRKSNIVANPLSRQSEIERLVDTTSNVGNLIDDGESTQMTNCTDESSSGKRHLDESQDESSGRKQIKRHEGDSIGEASRHQSPDNCGMSKDMRNFYNKSWGGEKFSVSTLQDNMPRQRSRWAILDEDLLRKKPYDPRKKRCTFCHEFGHSRSNCEKRLKGPCCYMCGDSGHTATRCPKTMCLTCGSKQAMYRETCEQCKSLQCSRCNSTGHRSDSCPDEWRQYHSTISTEQINFPSATVMKPSRMLSCSNCTRMGHDSTKCKQYHWSRHFTTPSHVSNYNNTAYRQPTVEIDLATTNDDDPLESEEDEEPSVQVLDEQKTTNQQQDTGLVKISFFHVPVVKGLQLSQVTIDKEIYSYNKFAVKEGEPWESYLICLEDVPGAHLGQVKSKMIEPHLYKKLSNFLDIEANVNIHEKNGKLYFYLQCEKTHVEALRNLSLQWFRREDYDKYYRHYVVTLPGQKTIVRNLKNLLNQYLNFANKIHSLEAYIVDFKKFIAQQDYVRTNQRVKANISGQALNNAIIRLLVKLLNVTLTAKQVQEMVAPLRRYLAISEKTQKQYAGNKAVLKTHTYHVDNVKHYLYYVYIWNCLCEPHLPQPLDQLANVNPQHLKTHLGYFYTIDEFFADPQTLQTMTAFLVDGSTAASQLQQPPTVTNNVDTPRTQQDSEKGFPGYNSTSLVDNFFHFTEVKGLQLSQLTYDKGLYTLKRCNPQDEARSSHLFESYLICLNDVPGVLVDEPIVAKRLCLKQLIDQTNCQMIVNVHVNNDKLYFYLKCEKSLIEGVKHLALQWFRRQETYKAQYSILPPDTLELEPAINEMLEDFAWDIERSLTDIIVHNKRLMCGKQRDERTLAKRRRLLLQVLMKLLNSLDGKQRLVESVERLWNEAVESGAKSLVPVPLPGLDKSKTEVLQIQRYLYLVYMLNCVSPHMPCPYDLLKRINPKYVKSHLGYFYEFEEFFSSAETLRSTVKNPTTPAIIDNRQDVSLNSKTAIATTSQMTNASTPVNKQTPMAQRKQRYWDPQNNMTQKLISNDRTPVVQNSTNNVYPNRSCNNQQQGFDPSMDFISLSSSTPTRNFHDNRSNNNNNNNSYGLRGAGFATTSNDPRTTQRLDLTNMEQYLRPSDNKKKQKLQLKILRVAKEKLNQARKTKNPVLIDEARKLEDKIRTFKLEMKDVDLLSRWIDSHKLKQMYDSVRRH